MTPKEELAEATRQFLMKGWRGLVDQRVIVTHLSTSHFKPGDRGVVLADGLNNEKGVLVRFDRHPLGVLWVRPRELRLLSIVEQVGEIDHPDPDPHDAEALGLL